MRSRTAHHLDEVPVLARGAGVTRNVADELAVDFAGGIETERSLDVGVLEVAVDRLGAANNQQAGILGFAVLSEYAAIGI